MAPVSISPIPRRVVAELPPDLAAICKDVYRVAADGARLHAIWLPGRNGHDGRATSRPTIVHSHGFNSSGGVVLARSASINGVSCVSPARRMPRRCWPGRWCGADTEQGLQFPAGGHTRARTLSRTVGPYRRQGHVRFDGLGDVASAGARPVVGRAFRQLVRRLNRAGVGYAAGEGVGSRPWCSTALPCCPMDSMPVCCTSRYTTAIQPVLRQFANPELIRKIESEYVWMPLLLIHGGGRHARPGLAQPTGLQVRPRPG